jgi:hypothetical protein
MHIMFFPIQDSVSREQYVIWNYLIMPTKIVCTNNILIDPYSVVLVCPYLTAKFYNLNTGIHNHNSLNVDFFLSWSMM